MKTLSLRIPEKLDRQIALEVSRRRVSKSVLVRELLARRLGGTSPSRKQPSFLDLAGDLLGRRSGPGDLSTNPKYMKDFGK